MMRKRKLQETEYDEQETLIQSRTPVTIEDLIKKDRKRLSVSAVFEIILIMMEIYVMFNMGEELLVIVIGLIPIAALLYLIITSAADIGQLSKQQDEEKYSEIVRAQKASYLVIKRNFEDLQARMDDMEDVSAIPTDQIIGAQKAVAKVTINRNKENAEALMNSNDMMIEQLQNMEDKLLSNNQEVLQKNQELLQKNQELLQKNQELENHINTLKSTIAGIESKVNCLESKASQPSVIINQAGTTPVTEGTMASQHPYMKPEINYGETVQPSGQSEELELDEPDISLDELEVDEPVYEIPTEENIEDLASMAESGNDSLEEDLEIPELDPELEAALANIAEEPTMEEVAEEASMDTELSLDELSLEEELPLEEAPEELEAEALAEEEAPEELEAEALAEEEAPEELEVEALPEEVPAEEPEAVEEAVTEPEEDPLSGLDTSDPNKQLSPDEIAAMFSAAGGDESVENVTEESEGEIVSETEQENSEDEASNIADALAGLDTSDPNKVMSPDEIQALFANL